MKRHANKGFTAIELMIVVAIIGILAAIVVPKIQELVACSKNKNSEACQEARENNPNYINKTGPNGVHIYKTVIIDGVEYRRVN